MNWGSFLVGVPIMVGVSTRAPDCWKLLQSPFEKPGVDVGSQKRDSMGHIGTLPYSQQPHNPIHCAKSAGKRRGAPHKTTVFYISQGFYYGLASVVLSSSGTDIGVDGVVANSMGGGCCCLGLAC